MKIMNFLKQFFSVSVLSLSLSTPSLAAVIDFENFNLSGAIFLDVGPALMFNNVSGSGINVQINEGADNRIYDLFAFGNDANTAGQALIDWNWPNGTNPSGTTILFDVGVSDFSLQAGDFGSDDDRLIIITAYDENDIVIGTNFVSWPASAFPPFATLSINASGIRKIVYKSGGIFANSTFIDNITFSAAAVPIPAAAFLFSTGLLGMLAIGRRKVAN